MADAYSKLRELMLHVAERSVDDPSFGAVKLNKILAFSDFRAYAQLGHAITGVPYAKLALGPAPRGGRETVRELVAAGDAELVPAGRRGHVQQRLVAQRPADTSVFTDDELAVVDRVVDELRHDTATLVSERSHTWDGWRAARPGDDIPYQTAFWSEHALTDDDVARARELAASAP